MFQFRQAVYCVQFGPLLSGIRLFFVVFGFRPVSAAFLFTSVTEFVPFSPLPAHIPSFPWLAIVYPDLLSEHTRPAKKSCMTAYGKEQKIIIPRSGAFTGSGI
jgi:hypothetical protein